MGQRAEFYKDWFNKHPEVKNDACGFQKMRKDYVAEYSDDRDVDSKDFRNARQRERS